MRLLLCLVLLSCPAAFAQKGTVFLITDAEGVGGVCRQDQTDPKDQEMRQLLTGETNAAVEGFLAGGAEAVIVWDGHDGSQTPPPPPHPPKSQAGGGGARPLMANGPLFSRRSVGGPAQKGDRPGRH